MRKNKTDYKKGDVVRVEYVAMGSNIKMSSVGIIYKNSHRHIYLGHNFRGLQPMDVTRIPLENVRNIELITPKEIDSVIEL